MVKFKFSLALLAIILLLPLTAAEIQVTANEESNILFVDSGDKVIFRAFGIENSSSILWDFGRNISGPDTRYSNLTEVEYTVQLRKIQYYFNSNYEDNEPVVKEIILIVSFEETFKEEVVHSEALFFAIAGTEIIMSLGLGYWTSLIRKEKVYL
ncbi:MAG: hypothetical protein CM15mP42_11570 [Methanobacteriota archaeon]|nr:MAG: hypothetical protein CM15mP42_11570 [Euryarchaeota archaeon]